MFKNEGALFLFLSVITISGVYGEETNYIKIGNNIYYKNENNLLEGVDIDTFRELKNPSGYRYNIPAGADKNAFYFYFTIRIPFENANKVKEICAFNDEGCAYIFLYEDMLYKIDLNEAKVKPLEVPPGLNTSSLFFYNPLDNILAPAYFSDGKKVYYLSWDAQKESPQFIVLNVNVKKFKAYSLYYKGEAFWGTDGKMVYVGSYLVRGADAATFEYLGAGYAKDKNKVYYFWGSEPYVIEEADPESFVMVKGRGVEAIDKNYIYNGGKRIGNKVK
ncbi:MAG TPA: DKNYY domain-containing protein [Termitinemataceae bacterium]|nr:DKNYY domain-containing protein [Termitinemataceae bacterium]HPQ01171.1 DKNYY domain-containing protein [Termitinemataceae bacterium]